VSRDLGGTLDETQLSLESQPGYKIEIFDLQSAVSDTIGTVVRELTLETITGPRQFTSDTKQIIVNEIASDFATSGVAVPVVEIQIEDVLGQFDPLTTEDDPTGDGRWLRRGNCIRVREGDVRVDDEFWPITFTGKLVGQAGYDFNRTGGGRTTVTMRALGREADYLDVEITSDAFAIGQSYLSMATAIALQEMGLDSDEIDWIVWGANLNGHLSLQFVEITPLVAIANLMMIEGLMPRFNGEGKLTQSLGLITQAPERVYQNLNRIIDIVRPFTEASPPNSVTVLGLDAALTERTQPEQPLIEVEFTTGFFESNVRREVYWSEDRRQLAKRIKMKVLHSVNGSQFRLGGEESFVTIPSPDGEGTIGAVITVGTGYAPYIIIFLSFAYVLLAAFPDLVAALVIGETISLGRIIQAAALSIVMSLITKIGRGQYRFDGEPFEYVYEELKSVAEKPGLTTETRKEITISNQAIQSQSDCDNVAVNTLFRVQALGSPRNITHVGDLRLTPDDVFEVPGPRSFQIQTEQRILVRPAPGADAPQRNWVCNELTALGLE
jgi:hypothetical protein